VAVKVTHDPQSKEILLGGTGQVHVEVVVDRLHRAGVEVELLAPKVPYLETIKGKAQNIEGKHKKQTGGRGQFAVVSMSTWSPCPTAAASSSSTTSWAAPCHASSSPPSKRACATA
jgi:translation elongation factor EF-G